MPFEYFEVTAEVGIRARGASYPEAFREGARALFDLMVDTSRVRPQRTVEIRLQAETLELLFADWLNQLLIERDRHGLVFAEFRLELEHTSSGWQLRGQAAGEPLDRARHDPRIDVKAVTYHRLRCYQTEGVYYAECVLDV
jgi:SHS2 domain-containing protein